ncbi:sorting and assembly machinery component 37 [Geosmithia morbida]|uniref:Sorting and assembly machinery component 37 n=1 Tax=Geosmithia morbida TaxID=1094350 RepID=A0A9P5D3L3_9HYPO|nr:sorting and assembly machinery component 37 [Geosmithia morbida]KAF4125072.1 sorting and assembly machinery component 37 [Geosmithia morbida]
MLELHIWGPAFGLTSIDPECIAIAAYLQRAVPSPSSWRLIPSNDASISPTNEIKQKDHLPALNHNGVWTSGFRHIVGYLSRHGLASDLDGHLTTRQRADSAAYSSFLAEHAAPLVDLSLYVSAANWSAATRPAYGDLLPWPLTWTVPPLIRQQAIDRSQHLGLAELDGDFDPTRGLHLSTGRESLPESFRRHLPATASNRSVRESMTPEQATAIRLFSLAGDCLSALTNLLSQSSSSSSDKDGGTARTTDTAATPAATLLGGPSISSLDCLALGYLSLMHDAPVPRAFLRDYIDQKAPQLKGYMAGVRRACSSLQEPPVAPPLPNTFLSVTTRALDTAIRNAPGLGEYYADEARYRAEHDIHGLDRRALMLVMGVVVTGAAVGYGVVAYRAMPPFGTRRQVWTQSRASSKLAQFGDLGSIISGALGPMPSSASVPASTGRLVDTDAELD